MANCCGGKNAGKRISWKRYMAGLGVFTLYHGGVSALLHVAAIPRQDLRRVRDFHRQVFAQDLKEILALEDINVNGRLDAVAEEGRDCELPAAAPVAQIVDADFAPEAA